jgi:hypothetical protein
MLIIAIFGLFLSGITNDVSAQKDTSRIRSPVLGPIAPVEGGQKNEGTSRSPSEKDPPRDNYQGTVSVDRPSESSTYFGQFKSLVERALFSNLLVLEQQYVITDEDGDDYELTAEKGVPVLSVGLVIGNKVIADINAVRPWQRDPRLAQVEGWEDPRFSDLRYRKLEDGARWDDVKTFTVDSMGGDLSVYEGIALKSKLEAVEGDEVEEGILMLVGYDKGSDPLEAKWHIDFTSATTDWENGKTGVSIPEFGKVYIGGFFLYPDISPGAVSFRVAGVLEMSDSGTSIRAITEPKVLNDSEVLKKKNKSNDDDDSRKKKKKRKRRRRG